MELQRIYEKFEKDLLETLPADQSDFISLLQKENIIGTEAIKKMSVFNRTRSIRAVAIVEEIEKSLSVSDENEKLSKLATIMKNYDDSLKPLAEKILNHIDPVGTSFVCETMADYLSRNRSLFADLPYKELKLYFVTYDIITYEEKMSLDRSRYHDDESQMRDVLSTIGHSLRCGRTKPFKTFLELLEESGDNRLQEKAKKIGGAERVPDCVQARQPTNIKIVLIPVGQSEKIQCDGKYGGTYRWKGHDFTITLPPDCADGTVPVALEAYLPISTQEHCFVSAVFAVCANTKIFKKTVSIHFPHWVNIKSETDKEKLFFLILYDNRFEVKKGSFEIGEPSGSIEIEISEACHIFICKKFAITYFTFVKAGRSVQSELMIMNISSYNTTTILFKERSTTTAMSETVKYNYIDMLLLPEYHDRKWGIYCITIDNPTYLQAIMKYFKDENWINSTNHVQVFKRQVTFEPPAENATAVLHLVDKSADEKIIKLLHNRKISAKVVNSLGLTVFQQTTQYGAVLSEEYKIDLPMCFLHVIGQLPSSSSKIKVDGLCGVGEESSEFNLASPTEYGYKFKIYQHIDPHIDIEKFNCKAVAEELKKELGTLSKLNYDAMKTLLIANNVITDQEMRIIDGKIGQEQMIYLVVNIIIPSLKVNNSEKYKGFLEAMEGSDDGDLKNIAKKLGGSKSIPCNPVP